MYRLKQLCHLVSNYHWINAYNEMIMIDELIKSISYIIPPVTIGL